MDESKADRMIALLEQIRDLQQQHLENYQKALRNQEESIAIQKVATGRFRNVIFPVILIAVVLIIIVVFFLFRILLRYRY